MRNFIHEVSDIFVKLLFPSRCAGCNRILNSFPQAGGFCPECKQNIVRLTEPVCQKCGRKLDSYLNEYCHDCKNMKHYFVRNRSIFAYEGAMKKAMYGFKYSNRRCLAKCFISASDKDLIDWIKKCGVEVIVPIPLHKRKLKQRGYNQAEVFARAISSVTDIPVDARLIVRTKETIPQKELNNIQRQKNLKNAFNICAKGVKYKRILLVDDIYTTGSTLDEASSVLLSNGAHHIYCMTICIGKS